jgi:hypothetical protein
VRRSRDGGYEIRPKRHAPPFDNWIDFQIFIEGVYVGEEMTFDSASREAKNLVAAYRRGELKL